MAVDFDFPSELVYDIGVDELLFGEGLECDDMFGLTLSGEIDVSVPVWDECYLPRPMCLPIWKSSMCQ